MYLQDLTNLVPPDKPTFRSKKDPKGGCGLLDSDLQLNVRLDFRKNGEKVATEIVSSVKYDNLAFARKEGDDVALTYYLLRVATANDHRVVGIIEADPVVAVPEGTLADVKSQSLLLRHLSYLPSGNYVLDAILRDKQTGCWGARTLRFVIP